MNIRPAEPSEAEKVVRELWLPLAREMEDISDYNRLEEDLDLEASIEHKKDKIASENAYMFVAEDGDELTGFISATVEESIPIFSRGAKLTINEMYVDPEHRRKGLASDMMGRIEEVAEDGDVETLELSVDVENDSAQELYRAHGFETGRKRMIKWMD